MIRKSTASAGTIFLMIEKLLYEKKLPQHCDDMFECRNGRETYDKYELFSVVVFILTKQHTILP